MPMTRHRPAILATAALAALAACGDAPTAAPQAPDESTLAAAPGTPVAGAPVVGTPAAGATTADTARATNFPAAVRVHGRLLAKSYEPGSTAADTLSGFAPVPGQRITLFRNLLVDGRGVSQRIGEVTTGADGGYAFDGVPGGYYVLALNVTAARPWGSHVAYAIGDRADLEVTVRFWRMPDGPAGGSSTPTDSTGNR